MRLNISGKARAREGEDRQDSCVCCWLIGGDYIDIVGCGAMDNRGWAGGVRIDNRVLDGTKCQLLHATVLSQVRDGVMQCPNTNKSHYLAGQAPMFCMAECAFLAETSATICAFICEDKGVMTLLQHACVETRNPFSGASMDGRDRLADNTTPQRQFRGGGPKPSGTDDNVDTFLNKDEAHQLVLACLLSKAGSWEAVNSMMQQEWVSKWNGWEELQENSTEKMCMQVAARIYTIAAGQMPMTTQTNAAALQGLEAAGLSLQRAKSFGMNNCLIDSLILCLCASRHLPCNLVADVPARCQLTVRCRDALARNIGPIVQATPAGGFPYLDAERDGPAVIKFLCNEFKVCPLPHIVLRVHDRFGNTLGAVARNIIPMPWHAPVPSAQKTEIHIFNHTTENGQGYHFDSLKLKSSSAVNHDLDVKTTHQPQKNQTGSERVSNAPILQPWQASQESEASPADTTDALSVVAAADRQNDRNNKVTTYLKKEDAQRLVADRLISKAGNQQAAIALMQQLRWTSEWNGWQELQQNMTDQMCMQVADRLFTIASHHVSAPTLTNTEALQALKEAGFSLQQAESFGMNNCLIDSLILSLSASLHLPCHLKEDRPTRCQLTIQCRNALVDEIGPAVGATCAGDFPHLDATRDGPSVVKFLCNKFKLLPLPQIILRVHTRFDHAVAAATHNSIPMPWHLTAPWTEASEIHIFNYTAENGEGYYFDSLKLQAAPFTQQGWVPHTLQYDQSRTGVGQPVTGKEMLHTKQAKLDIQHAEGSAPQFACSAERTLNAARTDEPTNDAQAIINQSDMQICVAETLQQETDARAPTVSASGKTDVTQPSNSTRPRSRTPQRNSVILGTAGAATPPAEHASDDEAPATCVGDGVAHEHRQEVQNLLQAFFRSRCASITINAIDAKEVITAWNDAIQLRAKLLTLLQAGLNHADAGASAAERLRQQWAAYYYACTQGPGKKLGNSGKNSTDHKRLQLRPDVTLPRKRLRGKTSVHSSADASARTPTEDGEQTLQGDEYLLTVWKTTHGNPDPRAALDAELETLITGHLRPKPLLPSWLEADASDIGYDTMDFYCSFQKCEFATNCQKTFEEHLLAAHSNVLSLEAVPGTRDDTVLLTYRRALTAACQKTAPGVHRAIDRRCLRQYRQALASDRVGAAICFVCARRFPYTSGMQVGEEIHWTYVFVAKTNELLGLPMEQAKDILGYDAYWRQYGSQLPESVHTHLREDLRDWTAVVHTEDASFTIICCPEDKICKRRCQRNHICTSCRAPVCHACWAQLAKQKRVPPAALANDLLIFYAPKQIYEQEVTFMELVCASPCFTAMTCFSLEKKRLADRALDQDAFMPRNRLICRGNATTFPLPWEDLAHKLQTAESQSQEGTLLLPRVGTELAETINVIIKAGAWNSDDTDPAKIIHQARVRRAVVLELLRNARERGHPAYTNLDLNAAAARCETLPEDGVPAEIIALLPHDSDLDHVQRQKAATPVREHLSAEEVQAEFTNMCKPNAVVNERTSSGFGDANAQQVAALHQLASAQKPKDQTLIIHTGNRLLDQFEPWYFAFAFPFLFPYGIGMPDPPAWSAKQRQRRQEQAPRMEFSSWMRCLSRRCEAQINRDWIFGFALWNLFFRSKINLAPRMHIYETQIYDEKHNTFRSLQSQDIEDGALQLLNALSGTYKDSRGNSKAVKGDITKLAYVPGLRPGARKLLQSVQKISTELPGTQEARKQMRHEIKAMRIRYGVPLFITVSPDEVHQWLFIRMSRTRQCDPVRSASPWQEWTCGDREFPPLDGDIDFSIQVERLCRALPTWEQRRAILARDPLASVDGFRTLLQLLLQHVFGLNFCAKCPDCEHLGTPCMDEAGSNANLMGGVFGRMEAVYVTIEAQKSTGSLHGHMQCFVQCLHQHTPLTEIFALPMEKLRALRRDYCRYNAHVAHSIYSGQTESEIEAGIQDAEASWPEHSQNQTMLSVPRYQTERTAIPTTKDEWNTFRLEAEQWTKAYLTDDVVRLQYLKQHHYHPLNAETGERVPLRGCQKNDAKGICKSQFPRSAWLCPIAKILCPCEMERHGFPQRGRKNRLGALHGPYGHAYLNPCHPAVLAALRGTNTDVQIPYRLPFACDICGEMPSIAEKRAIALAAQRAQDAQTGYCSDYCSKNQPMGFHEIKEFQKGHIALHTTLTDSDLNSMGKRHASRLLSDAYCKGLVRGQVECCNLRANHVEGQIVAAERLSTSGFAMFPGHVFVRLLEQLTGDTEDQPQRRHYVKTGVPKAGGCKHLRESMTSQAYGHRPVDSDTWWLSPYEFTMHWEIRPTRVPYTKREWKSTVPKDWDVTLTEAGSNKLNASELDEPLRLKPGLHYTIRLPGGKNCVLFPPKAATARKLAWKIYNLGRLFVRVAATLTFRRDEAVRG